MKNLNRITAIVLISIALLSSCKKQEGVGGDASIKGKIHVKHYNSTFTQFISEYDGADLYVYLIFGDDISYGTRIKTTYNGEFEFKYLYKGDYKVYTYSLDSTLTVPGGKVAVTMDVNIGSKKESVDIGTIEIFN